MSGWFDMDTQVVRWQQRGCNASRRSDKAWWRRSAPCTSAPYFGNDCHLPSRSFPTFLRMVVWLRAVMIILKSFPFFAEPSQEKMLPSDLVLLGDTAVEVVCRYRIASLLCCYDKNKDTEYRVLVPVLPAIDSIQYSLATVSKSPVRRLLGRKLRVYEFLYPGSLWSRLSIHWNPKLISYHLTTISFNDVQTGVAVNWSQTMGDDGKMRRISTLKCRADSLSREHRCWKVTTLSAKDSTIVVELLTGEWLTR